MADVRSSLDRDLPDPTRDIPDYLQATFEKIASQNGGKHDKVNQYRSLAVKGQSPSDVMAQSYDEQMKRDDQKFNELIPKQADIRTDPRFFSDAHSVNVADPIAVPLGSNDPMASPLGGGQPVQSQAPIVDPSQIDTSKLEGIQKQINDLLSKPHPVYEGAPMPEPNSAQALLTGLALAFAPPSQAGKIIGALHGELSAVRQRNDVIHQLWQKTQDENDKNQLEALMKQATLEEGRAFHQAQLNNQARVANANNSVKTDTQDRLDKRAKLRADTQIQAIEKKIAAAPLKEAQELQHNLDAQVSIQKSLGYDDEEALVRAAAIVNSKAELQIAQTQNVQARTLTENDLRDLKKQNLGSQIAYRDALKEFLPDRIAAMYAGVLLADERLRIQVDMFKAGLDQKSYDLNLKAAQDSVEQMQRNYDSLSKEARADDDKRSSEYAKADAELKALAPLVLDGKGNLNPNADQKSLADYRYWQQIRSNAARPSNASQAIHDAEFTLEQAKERLKTIQKSRPAVNLSGPSGGVIGKAKGFIKGKLGKGRPPSLPGNLPSGQYYDPSFAPVEPNVPDSIKKGGLHSGNPFMDSVT